MKFTKKEKQFWKKNYHFDKPSQLHENWEQIWAVDSNHDDDFFHFFTLRVTSITDVYLKDTLITDQAVEYMVAFKNLKNLFIRRHENITKGSIPFINQMKFLETLNVTKTQITLCDLAGNLNNQNLREVSLDGNKDGENTAQNLLILKERMPNCEFILI